MKRQIAPLILGLGLLASSFTPIDTLAAGNHQSGVIGQVFLYACPVVFPGEVCDHPYQTSITVVTRSGNFVTRVITDPDGHFEIFLKPGHYVLIPAGALRPGLPSVETVDVRVEKKQFTSVTIVYDSGIR